ncbi:hypothetical protein V5799_021263 [Amblyomma americanum]|uniref:Uncharacterized protein n=1 Tax=Amblyomma americanum TaxID=6943 RepID=A0AAQ4FQA5_AMBAM
MVSMQRTARYIAKYCSSASAIWVSSGKALHHRLWRKQVNGSGGRSRVVASVPRCPCVVFWLTTALLRRTDRAIACEIQRQASDYVPPAREAFAANAS